MKKTYLKKFINIFIKLDKIAFSTLVVTILSLIVAIKTDIIKKPVMSFNEVPVTFLYNNEYYGTYDLYLEEVNNDLSFSDKLATTVNIANPLSNDIQLNKIYISIDNIERDPKPYFKIYAHTKEDGVYVDIYNCGWGKAEDVEFVFICTDDRVLNYVKKNRVNIYVNSIDVGETIEYPLILNSDVKYTEAYCSFDFSVSCNIHGINMSKSIKSAYLNFDIFNGEIMDAGVGGGSDFIYGIKFNTNENSFTYERQIFEEIGSSQTIIIPICVYPDQSCTFDLDIKFQYLYNGKEKYIHCQKKDIKIDIDSSQDNVVKKDINNIDFSEIEEVISDWPGEIILSYPAINSITPYPRCPLCANILQCKMTLLNIYSGKNFNKIWYCDNCNKKY